MYSSSYYSRDKPRYAKVEQAQDDDISTVGSFLAAVLCFVLFCIVIMCIAYPFTMYRDRPAYTQRYADDKWWCYHCTDASFCGAKCW